MTIRIKEEIQHLQDIFCERETKIFHACQLQDFESYVKLGGVPSRNKLEKCGLPFTKFDTDDTDKKHGLWDKVFGNFADFGSKFAKSTSKSFPNPYGPILLVFTPSSLDHMTDIAISLRSAGARDFVRDSECLKSSQDVNLIYANPVRKGDHTDRFLAFDAQLNERFGRTNCKSAEFNSTLDGELISFENLAYVIVDNCCSGERLLIDKVKNMINKKVIARTYEGRRAEMMYELSSLLKFKDQTKATLAENKSLSSELKEYLPTVTDFHFNRFLKYLANGTVRT